jgi:hypothetical protein
MAGDCFMDTEADLSIAAKQGTTIIRMRFALLTLRAWSGLGDADFDAVVVGAVNDWIDGGMNGPVPWPDSPFFAEWALKRGWANIDGFIGFRFEAKLAAAMVTR